MNDLISELKFGPDGLIPAIAQDAATGEVLMVAWMNAESLQPHPRPPARPTTGRAAARNSGTRAKRAATSRR